MPTGVYTPIPDSVVADRLNAISVTAGGEGAAVNTPTAGTIAMAARKFGPIVEFTFTLTGARVPVTDGTTSGSYGTLKLCDLPQQAVSFLGCRQDYTAFAEGSALTTAAGDAVHVLGVGTTAISTARDGTLTGAEQNVGTVTSSITNSSGTGTGTQVTGAVTTALNGTASALALYLNWSGTAATIDATSNIDVTGTITVVCAYLGDD